MSEYMADLSALYGIGNTTASSQKKSSDLTMEDFLTLMIVQLQNQTIDDTADTSEMLNQMVQMQMITALTNMTDASLMSYASSLVGKEVTIGVVGNNGVEERVITVIGTGVSDGAQVIFGDDGNTYALSQIMAVGRLPDIEQPVQPDDSTDKPVEDVDQPGESTDDPMDGTDESGENAGVSGDGSAPSVDGTGQPADDRPVDPTDETENDIFEEDGDTVDPAAAAEGT